MRCISTRVSIPLQSPGTTTQLWRMAAEGQLIHIASSEESDQDMVLDVVSNLPRRPGEYTPLILRRRTLSSRLAYQTWRFTGDHLVLREAQNLCVQTKKGFESFREGKCTGTHLYLLKPFPSMLYNTFVAAIDTPTYYLSESHITKFSHDSNDRRGGNILVAKVLPPSPIFCFVACVWLSIFLATHRNAL